MKLKIINQNYIHAPGIANRLQPAADPDEKPWVAFGSGKFARFHTHAEAIAYTEDVIAQTPMEVTA